MVVQLTQGSQKDSSTTVFGVVCCSVRQSLCSLPAVLAWCRTAGHLEGHGPKLRRNQVVHVDVCGMTVVGSPVCVQPVFWQQPDTLIGLVAPGIWQVCRLVVGQVCQTVYETACVVAVVYRPVDCLLLCGAPSNLPVVFWSCCCTSWTAACCAISDGLQW